VECDAWKAGTKYTCHWVDFDRLRRDFFKPQVGSAQKLCQFATVPFCCLVTCDGTAGPGWVPEAAWAWAVATGNTTVMRRLCPPDSAAPYYLFRKPWRRSGSTGVAVSGTGSVPYRCPPQQHGSNRRVECHPSAILEPREWHGPKWLRVVTWPCSVLFCKFYIRWRPIKASDELVGEL
jgi:hypothetical protein